MQRCLHFIHSKMELKEKSKNLLPFVKKRNFLIFQVSQSFELIIVYVTQKWNKWEKSLFFL